MLSGCVCICRYQEKPDNEQQNEDPVFTSRETEDV